MNKAQEKAFATMSKEGFAFDEESHLYLLDGRPLTGVTTILGVIAKPSLIQWAADMAVTFLGWFDVRYCEDKVAAQKEFEARWKEVITLPFEKFFSLLGEARTQHAKRKKAAGDIGKYAHKWIENYIQAKIKGTALPVRDAAIGHMTDNFVKWAEDNKVKFLASEVRVYSRKYWYAGTFDILCEINGKIFIADIKTGSGIYPEHFFQMGGYDLAIREMMESEGLLIDGQRIERTDGYTVLNIKKNGEFEKREYYNLVVAKDCFVAALTLYRGIEQLTIKK